MFRCWPSILRSAYRRPTTNRCADWIRKLCRVCSRTSGRETFASWESDIHAAALECEGQWIHPIDFPSLGSAFPATDLAPAGSSAHSTALLRDRPDDDPDLDHAIYRHIHLVLARVDGNKLRSARLLGISRSALYHLLDTSGNSENT